MKVSEIKINPIYRGDEARVSFSVGDVVDMDFEPVIAAYLAHKLLKAANYFDDRLPVLSDDVKFNIVEEGHVWRECACVSCEAIRTRTELNGGNIHDY